MTKRCLLCYKPIVNEQTDYHQVCAKKLFGQNATPLIDLNENDFEEIARTNILNRKTITGVQNKLSLDFVSEFRKAEKVTLNTTSNFFILKPQSAKYEQLPENEDLTMHLAQLSNIEVAKHGLVRTTSGNLVYLSKRFDRIKNDKIAVEDFCQLSGQLTERKYSGSIEKMGKIILTYTENSGFELQRLFDIVLFCFLTGNSDMHLKNFSLIENSLGQYQLSPAYDLLNTEIVIDDNEQSALNINGKKNKLKRSDFEVLAQSLKINPVATNNIFKKYMAIMPKWTELIDYSFLTDQNKNRYKEVVNNRFDILFGKRQ